MTLSPPKNPVIRYGSLIGLYWFTYNTMLIFANMLYQSEGFSNYELGIASTCTALSNVVAQPLWGTVCDRMPRIRKVIALGLFCAMLATLIRFIDTGSKWMIVLSMCLVNFCFLPMSSLIDAWINRMNANGMHINYGPTRSCGSVGGMVGSLIFGILVDRFGIVVMVPSFLLCSAALIAYVFTLYEPTAVIAAKAKQASADEETFGQVLKKLLKNRQYLILIFTYMFCMAALNSANTFLSVKISDLGGGFWEFGTINAITAGCEIVFLVFLPKITRRIRPQGIMAIGFFFVMVRVICLALANSIPTIQLVSMLHGPSIGMMIGGVVTYLSAVVDRKSYFTAQTGFAALSGTGQILGGYFGGVIATYVPVNTMILMMAVLPAIGFSVMGLNFLAVRKRDVERV